MEIKAVKQNGIITVTLAGRLDMANALTAEQAFLKYSKSGNVFELEMSQVDFVSSAGVRALLTLYRIVTENNGSVTILNPTDQIMEVLEETDFDALFTIKRG